MRCFDEDENKTPSTGTKVDIPDAWLRPVTGLPIDEEIFDEVPA
jgi:hypothetical protein